MKLSKLSCLLVAVMLHAGVFAQTSFNSINSLAGRFVTSVRNNDKEKIILRTDRNVYATGEKIWFKALLVKALNNRLDTVSKNLFVDLVNSDGLAVNKLVLNVSTLHTSGAITLNDSLNGGYYWLRCYTMRMLNTDTAGIAIEPIYVINSKTPEDVENARHQKVSNTLNVEFLPEGGNLITGLNSTSGIHITDVNGNAVITTGTIVNSHDSVVASFATNKFGLAKATFYPVWFQKYFLVVHTSGQDSRYPLPPFNRFAAQLSVVSQSDDAITVHVALEDSIYSKSYTTYLLGISRDSLCFASVGRGMYQVNIPTENFPGGIADLLLFDGDQNLMSERKIFLNKDNYNIKITPDKPAYGARENAKVSFEVTDAAGHPEIASLSVAVQEEHMQKMSDAAETDTLMPASLSMDDWLKRDRAKFTAADIDLFMLGSKQQFKGWRNDAAAPKPDYDAASVDALTNLKGKIANRKGDPVPNEIVTVLSQDKSLTFFDVDTTKVDGLFKLSLPMGKENIQLKLQVTDMGGRPQLQSRIIVDTFIFPRFATPLALEDKFSVSNVRTFQRIRKFYTDSFFTEMVKGGLAPVIVQTVAGKTADYDTTKRISKFTHIYTSTDLQSFGSSLQNMVYSLPGMVIKNGFVTFLSQTSATTVSANDEPIVVQDGVQIQLSGSDNLTMPSPLMQYLSTLNPKEIDFIEVISGPEGANYGARGANGVIVINTRTRTVASGLDFGIKIITPVTYHVSPAFAMPDYAIKAVKNAKTPDTRTTIYWNGDLITDPAGKCSVSFYTTDAPANYVVTITGITSNGDYINKQIVISKK